MDIAMVIRRLDTAANWFLFLTEDREWSPRMSDAYRYVSLLAFTDAKELGGEVCLRFANGHEIKVEYEQMFEKQGALH